MTQSTGNAIIETPVGWASIRGTDEAITHLSLHETKPAGANAGPLQREAVRQLEAYFAGKLNVFDLPLQAAGSDFAKRVWQQMLAIPYGRTRTYGDVATTLQAPAQQVGQACGQNPIAIIIPCHRIVGTNWLGGFSSALGTYSKTFLLDLECGQQRLL